MNKKCERLLDKAVSCSLKNDNKHARKYFDKAFKYASDSESAAQVNYQKGSFDLRNQDIVSAEKHLRSAADGMSDGKEKAVALLELGKSLLAQKKIDDAVEIFDKADKMTDGIDAHFEIKTLLSESKMLSEKVYETSDFTKAADYLIDNKCDVPALLFRACSMAAVACSCMKYNNSAAYYGLTALNNAEKTSDASLAVECAVFACRNAIEKGPDEKLVSVTDKAFDLVLSNGLTEREDAQLLCLLGSGARIRHGLAEAQGNNSRSVGTVLDAIGKSYASAFTLYLGKFYSLLLQTGKAGLEKTLEAAANEPKYAQLADDIEKRETAERAYSLGFNDACCPLFSHLLEKTTDKTERIRLLSQYSKACFILGDSDRCTVLCRELVALCYETEADNATTADTYLLLSRAQMKSGDTVGATASYDIYMKYACNGFESEYSAAKRAFDDSYPSDYCAKLFRALSDKCEKEGIKGEDAVDINNRLGISLYRAEAPLEEETKAFELADAAADDDAELKCSNFHAVILSNLAECYSRAGNPDKALETYKKADDIFETCKGADIIQHTTSLKHMATILIGREDYDGALKYLDRAVSALENFNVKYGTPQTRFQLSLCLNARGTVYYRMDRAEKEVLDLTKALQVIDSGNASADDMAMIYTNRGEAYEKLNDGEAMTADFLKAIELLESCSDKDTSADNMISRATKWLSIGQYRSDINDHGESANSYRTACELLDKSEKISGTDGEFQQLHAYSFFQYANACCHPFNRNYNDSLSAYCRSIEILEALPESETRSSHLASVYEARSAFYEVFGEHALAVADLEKVKQYQAEE